LFAIFCASAHDRIRLHSKRRASQPKDALIFRCATTGDEKKDFVFGAYICAKREGTEYVANEIGLFHREGHPEEFRALTRFVEDSAYEVGSVENSGVRFS
jgi:hypothetical protein